MSHISIEIGVTSDRLYTAVNSQLMLNQSYVFKFYKEFFCWLLQFLLDILMNFAGIAWNCSKVFLDFFQTFSELFLDFFWIFSRLFPLFLEKGRNRSEKVWKKVGKNSSSLEKIRIFSRPFPKFFQIFSEVFPTKKIYKPKFFVNFKFLILKY